MNAPVRERNMNTPLEHYDDALILLNLLCETWPDCFKRDGVKPLPLKVGIGNDIRAELGGLVDDAVIDTAFKLYCHRLAYYRAVAKPGAVRVDLQGKAVGQVSEDEQHHATALLKRRMAKYNQEGQTNGITQHGISKRQSNPGSGTTVRQHGNGTADLRHGRESQLSAKRRVAKGNNVR